jgi:hypothetical protein
MEQHSRLGLVAFGVVAIVGAALLYGPISSSLDRATAFVFGADDPYSWDAWGNSWDAGAYDWGSSWTQDDPYRAPESYGESIDYATSSDQMDAIDLYVETETEHSLIDDSSWWNSVRSWWGTSWY